MPFSLLQVHGNFTTAMERAIVVGKLVASAAAGTSPDGQLKSRHAEALIMPLLKRDHAARPTAAEFNAQITSLGLICESTATTLHADG